MVESVKSPPSKAENEALKYARAALTFMNERGIEPTPINYAVWFHYSLGDKKELTHEIDQLLQKKTQHISDDVTIYLFNKYIMPKTDSTPVEQAAQNTQAVLAEIMQVMERFGDNAAAYGKEIDTHVITLSQKITDPALKDMVKEIINRSVSIRDSGSALNLKLEESKREVTELKNNLAKVTHEAHRDHLTGTGNRKALEAKLEELTVTAKEKSEDLCLLMIDIDHFKRFNDKYGHLIGDEILRKVGRALLDSVKGKDFVARYGGEEFAVLLPKTPLAGGLAVAEGLRKNIAETDLVRKDTGESLGLVTVSMGVARYRPGADSIAMLISRADSALYRSKMGGRNRVTQESFEPA